MDHDCTEQSLQDWILHLAIPVVVITTRCPISQFGYDPGVEIIHRSVPRGLPRVCAGRPWPRAAPDEMTSVVPLRDLCLSTGEACPRRSGPGCLTRYSADFVRTDTAHLNLFTLQGGRMLSHTTLQSCVYALLPTAHNSIGSDIWKRNLTVLSDTSTHTN